MFSIPLSFSRISRLAVLALLLTAPSASAQGFIAPFLGATMGGDTESRANVYGATLGFGGPIGLDIDFARTPRLFDGGDLDNRDTRLGVTTLMFNLRLGGPSLTAGVRPYLSGGAGIIRSRITTRDAAFDGNTRSDFGVNAGGGIDFQFGSAVSIRGDLRYFRSRADEDGLRFDGYDSGLDRLTFWRASVGVAFRF